jgi:GNAT superfamily N-acetyltransferase
MLSDHSLSCRLERAEAMANAGFVEARARLAPTLGAEWIEVAGAYAMYDGPRSPCTQTFGLGLFAMPTPSDMEKLEAFFKERGAPVFHEVSPIAAKSLLPIFRERGYQPVELTTVMFLPLDGRDLAPLAGAHGLQVRIVGEQEREIWSQTAAEGWREFTEFADLMLDLGRVTAARKDGACFLVDLQGRAIAAGALAIHDRVGLLAGASTVPEWRRRGAQRALLESRLRYAAQAGCDIAMMCAEPGSASQRNAERQGFRIAYTRIKFGLVGL